MTVCRKPTTASALCFAPHPDDEILGPGGTLFLHAQQGDPVAVVVATDGVAGDPEGRFDAATYAECRRQESRAAAAELGFAPPRFWGLPDSCEVAEADKVRLVAMVAAALREVGPGVVYLPWHGDHNSDHLALHEVVVRGMQESGFRGEAWGYEVWAPNPLPDLVVDISEVRAAKQRALAHFLTQHAYGDLDHPVFGMNAYRSLLVERAGSYGEAFEDVARSVDPA